jgi:hypothetical protein
MRNMNNVLAWTLVLSLVILAAAAQAQKPSAAGPAAPAAKAPAGAPTPTPTPAPSTVMATVDNKTLTYGDIQTFRKFFTRQSMAMDDDRLVNLWKINTYLADKAHKEKIDSDPELKTILEWIDSQILTNVLITKRQLGNPVTDEEIKEYYDKHKNERQYREGEIVTGKLIAVEKQDEANKIKADLVKGANFDKTVEQYTDQTKKTIGLSTPEIKAMPRDQLAKVVGYPIAFRMATSNLNEVIGPQQGVKGWILFKVTARQPGNAIPLEKVKSDIQQILQRTKTQSVQKELIEEAEKATGATYFPKGGAKRPGQKTVYMRGDQ